MKNPLGLTPKQQLELAKQAARRAARAIAAAAPKLQLLQIREKESAGKPGGEPSEKGEG